MLCTIMQSRVDAGQGSFGHTFHMPNMDRFSATTVSPFIDEPHAYALPRNTVRNLPFQDIKANLIATTTAKAHSAGPRTETVGEFWPQTNVMAPFATTADYTPTHRLKSMDLGLPSLCAGTTQLARKISGGSNSSDGLSCGYQVPSSHQGKQAEANDEDATPDSESPGAKRKRCKVEWCGKYAQQGGACIRHGARKKLCNIGSCQKRAVKSGVCVAHGAKVKRCKFSGCQKRSVKSGVCIAHGAKVNRCSIDDCEEYARKGRGLCVAHGAVVHAPRCAVAGCTRYAKALTRCLVHSRESDDPTSITVSSTRGETISL